MSRDRSIALISVVDPADAAESIATALRSKTAAARFVRAVLDQLTPAPEPATLFDEVPS